MGERSGGRGAPSEQLAPGLPALARSDASLGTHRFASQSSHLHPAVATGGKYAPASLILRHTAPPLSLQMPTNPQWYSLFCPLPIQSSPGYIGRSQSDQKSNLKPVHETHPQKHTPSYISTESQPHTNTHPHAHLHAHYHIEFTRLLSRLLRFPFL
jgi:hypothetical protein